MILDKPILELLDQFLADQVISELARKKYRENLHVFITWLTRNAGDVKSPKRSDIIQYRTWLIDSKKAATTVDAYMVPVRQLFRYLEESNLYENIAAGVHSPRRYDGYRKSYLTREQVQQLLDIINTNRLTGKRDYAIINLMVNTGMRCIEISRLDLCDITPDKQGYRVAIQGKGRLYKDRSVHIPESMMFFIHHYLLEREDLTGKNNPPLFINHSHCSSGRITPLTISKAIKRYLRAINIDSKKLTAHSLRHTAAINAIKAGAKITDVQSMLGHKYSSSTDIYLRALEAESAEEGTAVRLLNDYYHNGVKHNKNKQY
jgi:integrase/recombinase XerD